MSYKGTVKNGVIEIDGNAKPVEGMRVEINELPLPINQSWAEILKDVIGKADDLPEDAAVNYEHYMYGLPKQKP